MDIQNAIDIVRKSSYFLTILPRLSSNSTLLVLDQQAASQISNELNEAVSFLQNYAEMQSP